QHGADQHARPQVADLGTRVSPSRKHGKTLSAWDERLNCGTNVLMASGRIVRCGIGGPDDTPETEVASGRVDRLGKTGRRTIAPAIVRRTEMRTAFDHLARDANLRLTLVDAR